MYCQRCDCERTITLASTKIDANEFYPIHRCKKSQAKASKAKTVIPIPKILIMQVNAKHQRISICVLKY